MRVLFDPTPVSRIGVDVETGEVVIGPDFSCVAYMIEEYLARGMTSLVIPKSRPEVSLLSSMPEPIKRRVIVVDDQKSIAAARRVLSSTRSQIGASYNEERGTVRYSKNTEKGLCNLVTDCHNIIRRMAFGFEYQVQIEMSADISRRSLASLRHISNDSTERAVLAELESVLLDYESFSSTE